MIYFFITRKHSYTINTFIVEWAKELKSNLQILPYDKLPMLQNIGPGSFVFSDLERLSEKQLTLVGDFCDQLHAYDEKMPIINHPTTTLTRFNLLKKLHAAGINSFNVFKASDLECDIKYPIFFRLNNDHAGPRSGLLNSRSERDTFFMQALMAGYNMNELLQVEFCETKSEDGFYRKYSAFRIGEQVIPAHIIFSADWMAKDGEPPDKEKKQEQERYMANNPHADQIIEIFALAGIDYGRIDYSMLDGVIQTWEINTNPVLLKSRSKYKPYYMAVKKKLCVQLEEAFLSILDGGTAKDIQKTTQRITLQWKPEKYI